MLLHEVTGEGGASSLDGGGGGEHAVLAADVEVDLGEQAGNCQKYLVPAWNQPWTTVPHEEEEMLARVHRAFRSVVMVLPAHIDGRLNQEYR